MKFIKKKSKKLLYAGAALIMVFIICKALNKNIVIEGMDDEKKAKRQKRKDQKKECKAKAKAQKKCDKILSKKGGGGGGDDDDDDEDEDDD